MDQQNRASITLTTPTDVANAAAWLLGFHPTNSLVVLTFGGPAARARPRIAADRATRDLTEMMAT